MSLTGDQQDRNLRTTVNNPMVVFTLKNATGQSRNMLDGIQYLRGLCAVIVVISHCNGIIGKPEYYSKMPMADWHVASLFAVAAFFSISGFIIVVASLDRSGAVRTSRSEFARRRFVRIVPFLWLCIVGYNLLSWAGTGVMDWSSALRTVVLWPVGELKPNVAWSLRHELLFYVFFAGAILGSRRGSHLLLVWLAASATFYLLAYDAGLAASYAGRDWFEAIQVLIGGDHGANFQFALGLGFGYLYLLRPQVLPIGRIPPLAILILTALAGVIVTVWPLEYGLLACVIWTILIAPILASAICASPGTGLLEKAGIVLGNASFSIYLVHNPIVLVLLAAARKVGLAFEGQLGALAFLAFTVIITVIGGIAAHHLVELPLIRAFDQWTRRTARLPARIVVDQ
jgi:peptidoglycan/LPS O-acetylase OafA/YrhL